MNKKKESKVVPNVRFKGFTDDWKQRKLGEITDVRDGTHDSPKYVQEGHPFITSKNVSNGFINYDDVQYVTGADYEEINKRSKVDVHDILMGMIGTIGNLALIRKEPDFAIKNVALIKYTGDVDYQYLYQALQAGCVTNQLSTGMDGGTQKFVSLKKIRELDIPFPDGWEQRKIGAYFSTIDHLITLHQQKITLLTNLKKTMLEKMFPKKGSVIPEIRFNGVANAWEQRKLGDILEERTEKASGDEELLSVTIGNGVIRQVDSDKRNIASEDKSNYKIVKKGDIPYNSMRMWQGAVGNSEYDGIVSPAYTVLTPTVDANGKFFMELFKKESTLQIFQRWSQGLTSDTWNLKYPILSTIKFNIPPVEEQTRIAEYFSNLDHLITLHQRKLDMLKKLKSACLSEMFI